MRPMELFDSVSAIPLPGDAAAGAQAKSDAELIEAFLEGSDQGFATLLERHLPMVYRFVYRYLGNADDANDVTQETFIRAWKHIKKFDRGRSFKTWVMTIAKNASLDFIKKKKPLLFLASKAKKPTSMLSLRHTPETWSWPNVLCSIGRVLPIGSKQSLKSCRCRIVLC